MACDLQWPPGPGIFLYRVAIVRSVTVRIGSSIKRVGWVPGSRKVGGEIGVSGERYS
jgi:hypothetical protein